MFKVGDKVKLVEQYGRNEAGERGVVFGVRASSQGVYKGMQVAQMVSVRFDDGSLNTMFDIRLDYDSAWTCTARYLLPVSPMRAVVDTSDRIFPRRSYDTILKSLMEELGELSTEIAIKQGTKDRAPSPDGVKGEAVDVFVVAVDMLRAAWGDDLFSPEFDAKVAEKLAKWERK